METTRSWKWRSQTSMATSQTHVKWTQLHFVVTPCDLQLKPVFQMTCCHFGLSTTIWCCDDFYFFFNFIMFIFCATPTSCLTQGFIFQIPFHARIPHGSSKTGAQEKHKLLKGFRELSIIAVLGIVNEKMFQLQRASF